MELNATGSLARGAGSVVPALRHAGVLGRVLKRPSLTLVETQAVVDAGASIITLTAQ